MWLEASCHCDAVAFRVFAPHPYPFARCYCSICRKTAGGGGYAINIGADYATLKLWRGHEAIRVFHARLHETAEEAAVYSPGERRFCGHCGSALWAWDPRWPELVHPFASVIDTPLPEAPAQLHLMTGSKPGWVPLDAEPGDDVVAEYPDYSLAEWHDRRGLTSRAD